MNTAIYGGSFDPPTMGHLWMITQGAKMFDELIVVLANNPDKKYMFSVEQRVEQLKCITEHLYNVRVEVLESGLLVDYGYSVGARYLLRGIRNTVDFEYEKSMERFNKDARPELQTVFLMPPVELENVSSSLIRGLMVDKETQKYIEKHLPKKVHEKVQILLDKPSND